MSNQTDIDVREQVIDLLVEFHQRPPRDWNISDEIKPFLALIQERERLAVKCIKLRTMGGSSDYCEGWNRAVKELERQKSKHLKALAKEGDK